MPTMATDLISGLGFNLREPLVLQAYQTLWLQV